MSINFQRAAAVLKDALLRRLGEEVDLVFRYGSTIKGAAHKYSDLDLSYTPVHQDTWDSITVMVGNTLCDLYPIHWSKLEQMACFDDLSTTVLLDYEIVYARSEEVVQRFEALAARLHEHEQAPARAEMVRKALTFFQQTGYPFYLLSEAAAQGSLAACLKHSRSILQTVLHCLAVCNQRVIDTRKLAQVLSLPKLPEGFEGLVKRLVEASEPGGILNETQALLAGTRKLLVREQEQALKVDATFTEVFHSAYPEFKGDLLHTMLSAERKNPVDMPLIGLYHELMIHIAQAESGIQYSSFNSLADYELDLSRLGFPDLLGYSLARDEDGLRDACEAFDARLKEYLSEKGVSLNSFDSIEALERYLEKWP